MIKTRVADIACATELSAIRIDVKIHSQFTKGGANRHSCWRSNGSNIIVYWRVLRRPHEARKNLITNFDETILPKVVLPAFCILVDARVAAQTAFETGELRCRYTGSLRKVAQRHPSRAARIAYVRPHFEHLGFAVAHIAAACFIRPVFIGPDFKSHILPIQGKDVDQGGDGFQLRQPTGDMVFDPGQGFRPDPCTLRYRTLLLA